MVIAPHGALDDWALAKSSWKKKLAYRLWEGNNLHGAHCLQATSEREIQNFRDYGLKNPIARINNGVSQEQLESRGDGSRFRDRHGISKDRRLMLFIARISRQKGLPMLLAAMNALRSKLDDWTLVVGGADQDGHEQEVKDLVKSLRLEEHVIFVGPLFGEAKLDAFAASEVFVLPSHCEGSPMIVLEAMAGRLPVLCTKAASWGELETHACGWWPDIEEGSVRDALEDILTKSTAELEQMGERAHGLVAKEYSWKVAAERSVGLYAWLTLACAVLGAYASACPICRYTKHERNQHLAFIRFAGIKTKPEKMPELPSYMESVENQVRQCGKHGWFVRWRFMRGLKKAVAQPLQANWLSDTSYYD